MGAIWGLTVLAFVVFGRRDVSPRSGALLFPVAGTRDPTLARSFAEMRGDRPHAAIDITADRGTAVRAATSGRIERMTSEGDGGIALEQISDDGAYCLYYAHLDGYAGSLAEGDALDAGAILGFVGTSGNAPPSAPHLHFAVRELEAGDDCWEGSPVDPFPLFAEQ